MNLIFQLSDILKEAKKQYLEVLSKEFKEAIFYCGEFNTIACGNNNEFMKYLYKKNGNNIKLIYVDPPFLSNTNYQATVFIKDIKLKIEAYEDYWKNNEAEYLKLLCVQCMLMKDLLRDDGSIMIHLDWHIVHYAKILLDEIFGKDNFLNEIIWQYKSGGSTKKHFSRKHDTILFYRKSKNHKFNVIKEKSYNRGYKPYHFKNVKEYKDDLGWYTMVNPKDVWNIDMVGRTSAERTGYATQKPIALLKKIIESTTDEGDIVADFFMGSGSTAIAADMLNRKFIGCDKGKIAVGLTIERLLKEKCNFNLLTDYTIKNCDELLGIKYCEKLKEYTLTIEKYHINRSNKKVIKSSLQDYNKLCKRAENFINYIIIVFDNGKRIAYYKYNEEGIKLREEEIGKEINVLVFDYFGNIVNQILKVNHGRIL